MMRAVILGVALVILAAAPAAADENFIPGGHSYSPDSGGLPPLNSEQDRINAQADMIQAEIYTKQREQQLFNSQLRRFQNEQELTGPDYLPEY
ncbi:hypothetical protein BH10PSE7_BH10PSE7_00690 [soil metagenome]